MKKLSYSIKYAKYFLYLIAIILVILAASIVYAYNSGSCQLDKKYECNKKFCLYKEFPIQLSNNAMNEIQTMLQNKSIQKRVEITSFAENIANCALPNKAGVTIPTNQIVKHSESIIPFYQNELRDKISNLLGFKVYPTDLSFTTSCVLLIYETEADWKNWD